MPVARRYSVLWIINPTVSLHASTLWCKKKLTLYTYCTYCTYSTPLIDKIYLNEPMVELDFEPETNQISIFISGVFELLGPNCACRTCKGQMRHQDLDKDDQICRVLV